jgi:DNA integrity scanning protein DisA with diadenylate cyclase activity
MHERSIRPYGAIVCRELPHLDHLGRVLPSEGLAADVLRSLADGRHALMLIVKGQPPQLLALHEFADTDQDYASRALWIEGLIVACDEAGVVRIVTAGSVTLIEGRRWITKDLVFESVEDIVQVVPVAQPEAVHRLLELCHHRISPAKSGATFIYSLDDEERVATGRDAGVAVHQLNLSVMNPADEPLILHQAKYRDGAIVVDSNGRLLSVNVMLRPSRASDHFVPAHTGTRHTSAARHTYDRPDVLAFVVSTDGPVTVFSDGKRVADLKMGNPQMPTPDMLTRVELHEDTCPHCGVQMTIRTLAGVGHNATHEVPCPACEQSAATVEGWFAEGFLRKTAQTIEALRTLRAKTPRF